MDPVHRTPTMEVAPHMADSAHAPRPGTLAPELPTAAPAPDRVTSTPSQQALEPQPGTQTPAVAPQPGQELRQATAAKTPVATTLPLQAEPILHPPQAHTPALRPPVSLRPRLEPGPIVPRRREHSTPLPPAARPRSRTTRLHPLPGTVVHMTPLRQRWVETATMQDHGTKTERLVLNVIYCGV
ncbi:hypothetical protein BDV41DRAFT_7625 [Aspergillus transmontanensis]|uniref:Uncharacterized protein n=1 Tax=Aspergillus transmontanensis TaxID=1034304 RepID=A0A5N6WKG5_9EURO|nr:hypothetical protein BDV41DRAFT_7625 [Aspergillus transmontanensis]